MTIPARAVAPGGPDPDGSRLLTSDAVGDLLRAAITHRGGELLSWTLDHVDSHPQHSTTATYAAVVRWPWGRRSELLGVSARASGRIATDERAEIFADGQREVAVWLYPHDPDLPGLGRAAFPTHMAMIIARAMGRPVQPHQITMEVVAYRPRRRAVIRVIVPDDTPRGERVFYVKVLRENIHAGIRARHDLLCDAGLPAPRVAAATADGLLVLDELPGQPLAAAIFGPRPPCTAEGLIDVLDAIPAQAARAPRRPPWSDAVDHYAEMVVRAVPEQERRVRWMAHEIAAGLAGIPPGDEPTHGDFHEGQVHVAQGRVCGLLDIDTIGPGRRVDDLACLVAHLSTIQRMNRVQLDKVRSLLRTWVPVFDERVDPHELRLRSAAVALSLATGPFRGQEKNWRIETDNILGAAETLVRQVR